MTEPYWVNVELALTIVSERFPDSSGLVGVVRDAGLLEGALARPPNKWYYEDPVPDLSDLAAAYCFSIIASHPFIDGNKRAGYAVAAVFLQKNGLVCRAHDDDITDAMLGVASGSMSEPELSEWFRRRGSTV